MFKRALIAFLSCGVVLGPACSRRAPLPSEVAFSPLTFPFLTRDDVCYDIIGLGAEIWIACALKEKGVIHFDGKAWRLQRFAGAGMYGTAFAVAPDGRLFLVGKNAMYASYANGQWHEKRAALLETGSIRGKALYDFADFSRAAWFQDSLMAVNVGNKGSLSRLTDGQWSFWDVPLEGPSAWALGLFAKGDSLAVCSPLFAAIYQQGRWSVQELPHRQGWMFGMDGMSMKDLWAVGYQKPLFGKQDALYHYDGAQWRRYRSPLGVPVYGISVARSDEAYAVGRGGSILEWNGKEWNALNGGTRQSLYACGKMPDGHVYVVGDRGTILRSRSRS